MGRLKINRGPPRPARNWRIIGFYCSSKEMKRIIRKLKEEGKYVYLRRQYNSNKKPYMIYTK